MNDPKNLYHLLGVPSAATTEEIQQAWQNKHSELERLQLSDATPEQQTEIRNQLTFLQYARDVLCDNERRAQHDQNLSAGPVIMSPAFPDIPHGRRYRHSNIHWFFLAVAIGGAIVWLWPSPKLAAQSPSVASPSPVSDLKQLPPAPPTVAPDLAITTAPGGEGSVVIPGSTAPVAATKTYSIEVDAENAPLLKKLVWSVYGIAGNRGFGTGILVEKEQLLTNCHVIAANIRHGKMAAINAVTREATEITEVAWLNHEDACLVRAPGLSGVVARLAFQSPNILGTHTHNIGFARGQLTSSQGEIIGWANRHGQTFMVTNNYCDHGVSGGPLVDDDGRLIGLTTGGPANRAYCVSVTLDTIAKLRLERLKPLALFPDQYSSNVSRRD